MDSRHTLQGLLGSEYSVSNFAMSGIKRKLAVGIEESVVLSKALLNHLTFLLTSSLIMVIFDLACQFQPPVPLSEIQGFGVVEMAFMAQQM